MHTKTKAPHFNHYIKPMVAAICFGFISAHAFGQSYPDGMAYEPPGSGSKGSSRQDQRELPTKYVDPNIKAPLELDSLDYELLLYQDEKTELDAKKRAIAKRIYEKNELKEFVDLLRKQARVGAIDSAKDEVSELTPKEIRKLREYKRGIREAENSPLESVEQVIRTINVDLESSNSVNVHVSPNNQSSIVFFDRNGSPWPISGEPIHNTEAFSAFKTGGKGHIAVFTIEKEFSESNAMVNLKGLDIPIPIRLVGTENKVDARLSARIPRYGPLTEERPVYNKNSPVDASPELLSIQNGDHVTDSLAYDIVSRNGSRNLGRAYYKKGKLYIRTPHSIVLPHIWESTRLLSGHRAYVTKAKEDLLLEVEGKQIEATLKKATSLEMTPKKSIFQE